MSDPFAALEIQLYRTESDLYLALSGRLVRGSCAQLERVLNTYFSTRFDRLMINLRYVTFADSAGLGLLVAQKVRCSREKMQFLVLEPSPEIDSVFKLSRLEMVFPIIRHEKASEMRAKIEKSEFRAELREDSVPPMPDPPENHARDADRSAPIQETISDSSAPEPASALADSHTRESNPHLEELCRQAVEMVRLGEYDQAVELYKQVLEVDCECLPALNNLALLYEKKPLWIPLAVKTWERVEKASRALGDEKHITRAQRRLVLLKADPLSAMDHLSGDQETMMG